MTIEQIIRETLDGFPGDDFVVDDAGGRRSSEAVDVREMAKEHKLPFIEGPDYIAVSQYNIVTNRTTYRVKRK